MAETLISPGVLARENDQSQITSQPIQAGAAIVGPTVKGQVNIPKLITTYSEYQANFGTTFQSGSDEYTFFTSISAWNYFNNGGTSLIVTKVASGSFTAATSSTIFNDKESGTISVGTNLFGSTKGCDGSDAAFSGAVAFTGGTGTGLTLTATTSTATGKLDVTDSELLALFNAGTNPTTLGDGSWTVPLTQGSNQTATASVVTVGNTISSITVTNTGSGYSAGAITIAEGLMGTNMLVGSSAITAGQVSGGTGFTPGVTLSSIEISQSYVNGTDVNAGGGSIIITIDGGQVPASATLTQGASRAYTVGDVIEIDAVYLNAAGGGAGTGTTSFTLVAGNILALSPQSSATITSVDLYNELDTMIADTAGSGYLVGDVLTIAAGALGAGSESGKISLVDADIVDANAFTLESRGQGVIMNSAGAENSQGALANGTNNNLRWEVVSPNTSSGTFSVIIRQGNDTTRAKSVLESFNNVSLDPKSPNYISRIIGDQTQVVRGSGTDVYLQTTGSYANASRYVRVKEVNYKTPNYLDNSGQPQSQFTASIPLQASGSFGDAVGSILTGTGKYYDKITASDTQGLVGENYTTAFNILANKDDFKYNLISAPGLFHSGYPSVLNTLIANTENRGDNIVILDLEAYASSITAVTSTAAALDTSYAASYWPWCMVTDPDSGQRVWVPAGVLLPGVYANNDRTAEAWFAPAGINRGGLGVVVQAERKLTQANRDSLYTGKVNPIATFPGRGVVVFGQKTLQNTASALDRVNVRRLLIALKNYISQVSDNLVFEQNTASTRNTFLAQVNPYLESVQQRQGLYAFKVVMNESNNGADVIDRNELRGAIYIQPTKTAEFIYLDFNILPTGAEFPA
jgi:phage tail sheath protein FI